MAIDLPLVLNTVSALAVVGAVVFAGLQVRAANRNRAEQSAITIVQIAQSEGWTRALHLLHTVPDGASADDIDAMGADVVRAVEEIGIRIETIGYLVFRRIVSIELVDQLFGGIVIFWWSRIRPFAERDRRRTANPKSYEWFQWLAERLSERRKLDAGAAAYERHIQWTE